MDLFPDGARVRLKNRVRGTYLAADEDGAGVSLSPHRAAPSAAWEVRRGRNLWGLHFTCLLLRSAASGRFLSVAPDHRGRRVAQRAYGEEDGGHPGAFLWRAIRPATERGSDADDDGGDGDDFAILLHVLGLAVRADDGRFDGVAAADLDLDSVSPLMHWSAEVEGAAAAPPLQLPRALLLDIAEVHGDQDPLAAGAEDDDQDVLLGLPAADGGADQVHGDHQGPMAGQDAAADGDVVLALPVADAGAVQREAALLYGRLEDLYRLMESQCEAALEHNRRIQNIQDEANLLRNWSRVRQDRRPHDEALIKIERSYDLQAKRASDIRLKLVRLGFPPLEEPAHLRHPNQFRR